MELCIGGLLPRVCPKALGPALVMVHVIKKKKMFARYSIVVLVVAGASLLNQDNRFSRSLLLWFLRI